MPGNTTGERVERGLPGETFVSVVALPADEARLGLRLLWAAVGLQAALLALGVLWVLHEWENAAHERTDCGTLLELKDELHKIQEKLK